MPLRALVVLAIALAGCTFSPSALESGGDASLADGAGAGLDGCVPGCTGAATLRTCTGPDQTCTYGCSAAGAPRCLQLVPSNGATQAMTTGTSAKTAAGGAITIYSDSGAITQGSSILRGAVTGLDAASGIYYAQLSATIGVLGVASLTVESGAPIVVTGTRALIIVSAGDVVLHDLIDVSAGSPPGDTCRVCQGPGGGTGGYVNTVLIPAGGCGPGGSPATGTAGGGGGAMAEAGATGGSETNAGSAAACPGPTLVPLVGGSGGGHGGTGNSGNGGAGGGALQITSFTQIRVSGAGSGIKAAGAGARTGGATGGGGGGGAGGGILLEAPTVLLEGTATLAANGGGGGEGGGTHDGTTGVFGATVAAGGGTGTTAGGNGGFAGTAPTPGGTGTYAGGGGGGRGIIRVNAVTYTNNGATISPAATSGPLPGQ